MGIGHGAPLCGSSPWRANGWPMSGGTKCAPCCRRGRRAPRVGDRPPTTAPASPASPSPSAPDAPGATSPPDWPRADRPAGGAWTPGPKPGPGPGSTACCCAGGDNAAGWPSNGPSPAAPRSGRFWGGPYRAQPHGPGEKGLQAARGRRRPRRGAGREGHADERAGREAGDSAAGRHSGRGGFAGPSPAPSGQRLGRPGLWRAVEHRCGTGAEGSNRCGGVRRRTRTVRGLVFSGWWWNMRCPGPISLAGGGGAANERLECRKDSMAWLLPYWRSSGFPML